MSPKCLISFLVRESLANFDGQRWYPTSSHVIDANSSRIHLVVGFVEHYFAQEPRRFLSGELKGPPPKRSLSGARDLLDVRFFLASRCRVSHLMIMYPNTQSSIRESFLFQRLNF